MTRKMHVVEDRRVSEQSKLIGSTIRTLTARWNAIKIEDDEEKVKAFILETKGAFEKFKGQLVINESLRPPFERVDLTKL